jgi:hypothetical protein
MRQMARYRLYRLLGVCVAFLLATATGWSQSIYLAGHAVGYDSESGAWGVSADGSVVVGWYYNAAGYWCLSLDGFGWHARPRHAGRRLERG